MKHFLRFFVYLAILAMLSACNFTEEADEKFGDQSFKTAISLIELHKVRTGSYPEKLQDLKFTGDWDPISINAVQYQRLADGYELNLKRGWISMPKQLSYPSEFWQGLGLKQSNIKPAK